MAMAVEIGVDILLNFRHLEGGGIWNPYCLETMYNLNGPAQAADPATCPLKYGRHHAQDARHNHAER